MLFASIFMALLFVVVVDVDIGEIDEVPIDGDQLIVGINSFS
jgi:hypothetical protein